MSVPGAVNPDGSIDAPQVDFFDRPQITAVIAIGAAPVACNLARTQNAAALPRLQPQLEGFRAWRWHARCADQVRADLRPPAEAVARGSDDPFHQPAHAEMLGLADHDHLAFDGGWGVAPDVEAARHRAAGIANEQGHPETEGRGHKGADRGNHRCRCDHPRPDAETCHGQPFSFSATSSFIRASCSPALAQAAVSCARLG